MLTLITKAQRAKRESEMKVTIDTQQDSYDDIHKVYQILANILQRKGNTVSHFTQTAEIAPETPVDTTNLMNMFDTPGSSSSSEKNVPEKAPDFSSFLNLAKDSSTRKEDKAEIEYY